LSAAILRPASVTSLMKIAEQTRHRSLAMLQVYSRRVDLFRDHAASSWL
jgi:hypothetical protein